MDIWTETLGAWVRREKPETPSAGHEKNSGSRSNAIIAASRRASGSDKGRSRQGARLARPEPRRIFTDVLLVHPATRTGAMIGITTWEGWP